MLRNLDNLQTLSRVKPATSYTSNSLRDPVRLRLAKAGIAAAAPQTIPQFFRESCKLYAHLPALGYKPKEITHNNYIESKSGDWTFDSYADFENKVEQVALLLMHVGLEPHTSVGVLAHNCPEWFYVNFGAMLAGGVIAGIYPTSSTEAIYHALRTAEATVCVVEDAEQLAKVRQVKPDLPKLKAVIQLRGPFGELEHGYYCWKDLMEIKYSSSLRVELEQRECDLCANECATLIFTSGTTGLPKAVMISHDSLVMNAKYAVTTMNCFRPGAEVSISFLPLNHIGGQLLEVFFSVMNGDCVYFADEDALKGSFMETVLSVRPTRLCGVPRVFEKIQERSIELELGKVNSDFKYQLALPIVFKLRAALGLERCKTILSVGAPLGKETNDFFLGIDLPLAVSYGLSENSGAVTYATQTSEICNVGKPIEGVEMKIDKPNSDGYGEVCVRGRSVMMGYLNEPTKTAEVLDESGWLHSGDLGYIKSDGSLMLKGRLKELIITAGGENIAPIRIEDLVKSELPCISNAMLIGDNRKYLTMLLTLKTELDPRTGIPLDTLHPITKEWLHNLGLKCKRLSEVLQIPANLPESDANTVKVRPDLRVISAIQEAIDRVNNKAISHSQRVQKFALLPHDFSIPTGELGPTLKLRRSVIIEKYAIIIEGMYS